MPEPLGATTIHWQLALQRSQRSYILEAVNLLSTDTGEEVMQRVRDKYFSEVRPPWATRLRHYLLCQHVVLEAAPLSSVSNLTNYY